MRPLRPAAALLAALLFAALLPHGDAGAQNRPRAARRPSPRTRIAALERVLGETQTRTDAATASAAAAQTRAERAERRAADATARAERAERGLAEATTRAERAEQRATDATARVGRAERRATDAAARVGRAEQRATDANTRAERAERRVADLEVARVAQEDADPALGAEPPSDAPPDAATEARVAAAVDPRPQPANDARPQPVTDARPPPPAGTPGPALPVGRALAALSGDACLAALRAHEVDFARVADADAPGVPTPVRLRGPIGGVRVGPRTDPASSPHAILDCRLALALLAWAPALRAADVVALEHYSAFRANARVGGRGPTSGHASGLALDAARFHLAGGEVAEVLVDWTERTRGVDPCTPRDDEPARARLLRGVVCEAVRSDLFQIVLTPHHDVAHHNHVHLELRPGVDWTYVR